MKVPVKKIICFSAIAIILAICIVANVFAARYSRNITAFLGGSGSDITLEQGEFSSKVGDDLVKKAGGESIIMLRNENDALPLENEAKVNVFGTASADKNWIYAGAGSGTGVVDPKYRQTLMTSLEEAGIKANEDLEKFYSEFEGVRAKTHYNLTEKFDLSFKNKVKGMNVKNWSSTAIVVLGRYAGETIDEIPLKQSADKTYLELTDEEGELLSYVKNDLGMEKVILVVNAANVMNLGFLESKTYGIDACLWTGFTGQSGAWGIGQILCGNLTPSAKTADTFQYTTAYDSTWVNNRNVASNLISSTDNMVEAESIYYGYKWYETADVEGYFDSVRTSYGTKQGYGGVVQYPFGFGLSYTNFEWKVVETSLQNNGKLALDSEVTIKVEVTNKGDMKGADVVELYYTPPYINGGIEKAAVNLLDFAKTPVLYPAKDANDTDKPNSATVELTFSAFDIASYDCWDLNDNGRTSWELDEGDYVLSLRTDSHTVADEIMAKGSNATLTYKVDKTLVFENDPVGGGKIDNVLTGDEAYAGVSVDGTNVGLERSNYLSRKDSFANYKNTLTSRTEGPSRENAKMKSARSYLNPTYETATMPTTGSTETNHKLITLEDGSTATFDQLNGKWGDAKPVYNKSFIHALASDFNADAWAELISQMTIPELKQLFHFGGFQTYAIASIGKVRNVDYDGPAGFNLTALKGSWEGGATNAEAIELIWTVLPSEAMLGASWNKNLLLEIGLFMGFEAQNTEAVSGWYAPGLNLHRSPYTNRNFEYYSEDAVLSGNLGANLIHGAKMNNLYCYMKHFVACEYGKNPGDTNTWLTEQSLRENYMKVFEIAVKEGKGNAIMTAFNNVGPVWCGANYATCTQILRDEWGFKGTLLTDICSVASAYEVGKFNHQQGLRAGQDIWLNNSTTMFNDIDENDPTMIACAQRAAKNIVWTSVDTYNYASTYERNQLDEIFGDNGEMSAKYAIELSVRIAPTPNEWWIPLAITIEVLVFVGCAVWIFFLVKEYIPFFNKKKATAEGEEPVQTETNDSEE